MIPKRNLKMISMLVIAFVLGSVITGTFAYFVVTFQDTRDEATSTISTQNLPDAVIVSDVSNAAGTFSKTNIYLGHKEVAALKVSAKGEAGSIANYQFKYEVKENGLGSNAVKVSVYENSEEIHTDNYFECEMETQVVDSVTRIFESCKDKSLGTLLQETILKGGSEEVILGKDNLVAIGSELEVSKNYYVVVEFINKEESQNDYMNSILNGVITVELITENVKYRESILNGTDPVIKDNLIPVTIDNDGTVKKADTKSEWYNYSKQQWANAVILKDESISYTTEQVIPEDNIESYFVWIPRYRYQIFNDSLYPEVTEVDNSKPQVINVVFETKEVPVSNGTHNNEWLTHPAFTSFGSNGMWVGKFETSKSNSTLDNEMNPMGVQIKPNEISWRNINVSNAFYTTYYYKRELDSHMMKNMEWGAVAYLQHSNYGSHTSVRINNNSDYKTGYASTKEPTCGYTGDNQDCNRYGTTSDITLPYNTEIGYLASTTGNISGIYDLSDGAWEYMMSVMVDENENPVSGQGATNNSGFIGSYSNESGSLISGYSFPDSKYYDTYARGTSTLEYTRRVLGDATGEMGSFQSVTYGSQNGRLISSWYADDSYFVFTVTPWFLRGGAYTFGSESGVFSFGANQGSALFHIGFRLVLTP